MVILYGGSVIAVCYNMMLEMINLYNYTKRSLIYLIPVLILPLFPEISFAGSCKKCALENLPLTENLAKKDITNESANEDFAKSLAKDAARIAEESARLNADLILDANQITSKALELKTTSSNPQLMVFVSSSMSIELLKSYYKDASRFGATLVFNGLPGGSFKNLQNIVLSIQEAQKQTTEIDLNNKASIVIDDESFKKYNITLVPSIVLSKEEKCASLVSCPIIFDKVTGNIGIIAALREFGKSGELAKESEEIIEAMGL